MLLPIANLVALSYEMKIACLSSQIFNESVSHAQYVGAYICSSYVFFRLSPLIPMKLGSLSNDDGDANFPVVNDRCQF